MFESILYCDPQAAKPACFCPKCGGERYAPSLICIKCSSGYVGTVNDRPAEKTVVSSRFRRTRNTVTGAH